MTSITATIRNCIKHFEFVKLFNELGWDHLTGDIPAMVDGIDYTLTKIAEKKGFQVFHCLIADTLAFPLAIVQNKIQRQVSKLAHENLIIYSDLKETRQSWRWAKREDGRLLKSRGGDYYKGHSGELLAQRLSQLAVTLDEEDGISLIDVTQRVRAVFDVDRVTKRFYELFKQEHGAFLEFVKGIKDVTKCEWYASLMLNRLMFVYFIQKKGFLDRNDHYLRDRLALSKSVKGKDKFHSFYRYFLLRLFHDGLNQRKADRNKELEQLLGEVPYLNGGLFDVHELEKEFPDIQIADEAFEKLFDFFDKYQWHLDDRPLRNDTEINPDVLGYIFEKYINQKQMGAYYTKEDITEYISKNTIIPYLFDAAEKRNAEAFHPSGAVWQLLRDDPDRYIYSAVGHGVFVDIHTGAMLDNPVPLPKNIAIGLDDVSKRGDWNQAAPAEFGLPTETWREHIARRQRCEELRGKLAAGEVTNINEMITNNLDICQFAQDVIENCESPDLLRAFYFTIAGRLEEIGKNHKHQQPLSVLDPTCGSGAFLFAALNILKPLYEACLARMAEFVQEADDSKPVTPDDALDALIAEGESKTLEFKSTARYDVALVERLTNVPAEKVAEVESKYDKDRTRDILKAVSAMLNTDGGDVLIGIQDDGTGFGIHHDYKYLGKKQDRDGYELWLTDLFEKQFGKTLVQCLNLSFAQRDGVEVCRVSIDPAPEPAYLKEDKSKKLYIRLGNSSRELEIEEIIKYHDKRFKNPPPSRKKHQPQSVSSRLPKTKSKFGDFRSILDDVTKHPNQHYFVLKSIIINNLYGVDIMPEAVEICKLRLFLKLMSVVEPQRSKDNLGVEALPDIDFNIRSGNTLVGYATLAQVRESVEKETRGAEFEQQLMAFDSSDEVARIDEQASIIDRAFKQFRRQQTELGGKVTSKEKDHLRSELRKLTDELDRFLAAGYGVKADKQVKKFSEWKSSHQPFHWFAEFFGIMATGGFNVIIGNPPYIELRQVFGYALSGYECLEAGNLYAIVMERCEIFASELTRQGFIVPVSSISTDRYVSLQRLLAKRELFYSSYDDRPSRLFDGLQHIRLTIHLLGKRAVSRTVSCLYSTRYNKWNSVARSSLFDNLQYAKAKECLVTNSFPKASTNLETFVLNRLAEEGRTLSDFYANRTQSPIYYSRKVGYFLQILDFEPMVLDGNGQRRPPSEFKEIGFCSQTNAKLALGCLNSSLFYWFITVFSDCRHVNKREVDLQICSLSTSSDFQSMPYVVRYWYWQTN